MSLSGSVYPCARCFKTTVAVIGEDRYDKDETPARVGVKFARRDGGSEIVCSGCLRNDYAAKVSPSKKLINSPANSVISTALRNDEDEEEEAQGDDADDNTPIKPLPRPSGLILSSKTDESDKKTDKIKKKLKKSTSEGESSKKTDKIKKRKKQSEGVTPADE